MPFQVVLTLANIFYNKILNSSTLNSRVIAKMLLYLQLLNSIKQWQKSGVLSNKEDKLKGIIVDNLRRLARFA